ncbi:MAG: iron-sulfur cluster repair protein YtfE [bacterium]|nr:iron-sulfur cluster repair protein YtfE [bacterium]
MSIAESTLAQLATTRPGASRVFHRHGLDFCCGGAVSLADASRAAGLDLEALASEIEAEDTSDAEAVRWDTQAAGEIIEHILTRYHAPLREELPRLLAMARKVEEVHGDKPTCPTGLAQHLEHMAQGLEMHMQKEEQVLFPLIQAGRGAMASMPIHVMEQEHKDAGNDLARLRELTDGYTPPAEACNTWRALFLGLAGLQEELMEHIHLENNVLFPKALAR